MLVTGLFTISEFARFSRLTRDTLLYYDRIGLLSPAERGENSYRLYSGNQLAVVNVVRILQQLGMSLEEIKKLKDSRTPELTDEVLGRQIGKIEKKIEDWIRARKLLLSIRRTIQSVDDLDENTISIKYMPEEPIVLGEPNDYSNGRNVLDALLSFYHEMSEKYPELDLNYFVWSVYSAERIKRGDWIGADRYYLYHPEGGDSKPGAFYAVGYTRGGYCQCGGLYKRLLEYIDDNGFEICGDTYEEYPLNEVCISDDNNYLIRIMITVRKKDKEGSN